MKAEFFLYFILKSIALVSFVFSTPILLNGLGDKDFGVWSTLSSFLTWVLILDFGIGNYLRNKIAEFSVLQKEEEALACLANACVLTMAISSVVFIVLSTISYFIDWNVLLGIEEGRTDIFIAVIFIIFFACISFLSNLIYFYFYGMQRSHFVAFLQSLTHIIFIVTIYISSKFHRLNLIDVSLLFGLSMVIPGGVISAYIFIKKGIVKNLGWNSSLKNGREYFSVGGKFFFIQITALILFSTDKVLLSHLFGPEVVTSYEVLFKVFSITVLFQSLILTPSWGKYSKDFFTQDLVGVNKTLKCNLILCFGLILSLVVMILSLDFILNFWLNKTIDNSILIFSMAIFFAVMLWNNVYAIFLNATSNIDLTFKICLVVSVVNIPLSYWLGQTSLKESGIVVGTIICLLPAAIATPFQTIKILREKSQM